MQEIIKQSGNPKAGKSSGIGSRRELFVDDAGIESMSGEARRLLHRPVAREPVMVLNNPWERGGNCTVFKDGDRYRMYYQGQKVRDEFGDALPRFGDDDFLICYAESRDGVKWDRPSLGLFEFNGSKDNNIIYTGKGSSGFAPFLDTRPGCPDAERYKAFGRARVIEDEVIDGSRHWQLLFLLTSADGIHWTAAMGPKRYGAILDQSVGHFDSQNLGFWDSEAGCYRLYFRWKRPIDGRDDLVGRDDGEGGVCKRPIVRDIVGCVSDDALNWRDLQLLQYPGSPEEELYTNQVQPYYRAPHIYLGFPTRYVENRGPLTPWHERMVRDFRPDRFYQSYTDGLIMSSRDGQVFQRWGGAFLRPGMPAS